MSDGKDLIPILFEIKEFKRKNNTLYFAVALKKEVDFFATTHSPISGYDVTDSTSN